MNGMHISGMFVEADIESAKAYIENAKSVTACMPNGVGSTAQTC